MDDKFKNGMLKRYNEFTTKMKASDVEGNIIDINIHEYLASVLFKLNSGRVFSKQKHLMNFQKRFQNRNLKKF